MKLFRKTAEKKKETKREKKLRTGLYSATAAEHTHMRGVARDGSLGGAQVVAVMNMLRDE